MSVGKIMKENIVEIRVVILSLGIKLQGDVSRSRGG